MDKILKSTLYLFSLITLANSAFEPIFGPPHFTLNCSADYVMPSKIVEVSWKPTLTLSALASNLTTADVIYRIQNCEAMIKCNGDHKDVIGCPSYDNITDSYMKWKFLIPLNVTNCFIQVRYYDDEDYTGSSYTNSKSCSYSAPNFTIFKQHSTGNMTVGEPYRIQCSVNTSEKMNNTIIKIDWSGPDDSIANNRRIIIHPTVSDDGIIHNSTLLFSYVSQNDAGLFTCNVTILGTTLSQTFQLDNIMTPEPSVSVIALTNQTLTKSLECSIITVRGITSSVDIVWMINGTKVRRMNDLLGSLVNNSVIHRDVYNVLNVIDASTEYQCYGVINGRPTVKGLFFLTAPTSNIPSPTTSMSPTTSKVSIFIAPTVYSTTSPSSVDAKSFTLTGSAKVAIIISVVFGFLLLSLLIALLVYKCRRKLNLKNGYPTNNDIHIKAPSISDIAYSITDKDDASTCENLDANDKIVGWIKTIQTPSLAEQYEDTYPTDEEILSYVCGQHSRCCDSRQSNKGAEYKELSKIEEGSCTSAKNSITIRGTLHSMVMDDYNSTKSALVIDESNSNDDSLLRQQSNCDAMVFCDSQSIQAVATNNKTMLASQNYVKLKTDGESVPNMTCIKYNTVCHCHSSQNSENNSHCSHCRNSFIANANNNTNQRISHASSNDSTIIEMANCDQISLDSSDKLTEETLVSSASSYSINTSLVEGEYIEHKTPTHNVVDKFIPVQQKIMTHFDGTTHSTTTVIEGEYVDRDIAVQENIHIAM